MGERPFSFTYVPPQSVEEALRRREELGQQLQDIAMQLGNSNQVDAEGRRLSEREYQVWRQKALYAKRCKERELLELKQYLREEGERRNGRAMDNATLRHEVHRVILQALVALLMGSEDEKRMAVEGLLLALRKIDGLAGDPLCAMTGNGQE